jgi:hypothetical protein
MLNNQHLYLEDQRGVRHDAPSWEALYIDRREVRQVGLWTGCMVLRNKSRNFSPLPYA